MDPARDRSLEARRALALALAATSVARRGLYLGSGQHGPVFAPPEHCALVVGPPRSGKTTGVVLPNVLAARGSVLAASTKPDVLRASAVARRALGPCMLFDPSGKADLPPGVERVGWSPITSAATWDGAVLIAEAMVGAARPSGGREDAAHWSERSGALLACMLHAAALDGSPDGARALDALVSAVNRHDPERSMTVLTREGADLALDLLTGIVATDPREQSGIWSTASGVLAGYRTEAALDSTRGPLFDPVAFAASPATLYVAASSEHQRHAAPLVAGLVRDVRGAAYDRFARFGLPSPSARGVTPDRVIPVLLVLDELAGIAPLHDLPQLVAEGASQGVVTLACLQDLSQARLRWASAADGFLTLFGTLIVLPGVGDTRTLEALSLLAGDVDVRQVATTRPARLFSRRATTRTTSTRRIRRLPPDEIANGRPGSAIVYVGTRPGRVQLTPYFAPVPREAGIAGRHAIQPRALGPAPQRGARTIGGR